MRADDSLGRRLEVTQESILRSRLAEKEQQVRLLNAALLKLQAELDRIRQARGSDPTPIPKPSKVSPQHTKYRQ